MTFILMAACGNDAPAPPAPPVRPPDTRPPLVRYGCVECHRVPPESHFDASCMWCHEDGRGWTRLTPAGLKAEKARLGAVTVLDAIRDGSATPEQRAAFERRGCVACHAGAGFTAEGEAIRSKGEGCRAWIERAAGKE